MPIKLSQRSDALFSLSELCLSNTDPVFPAFITFYNFIRNSDVRGPNDDKASSEKMLFEATEGEIQLLKRAKFPATWALQYDALINPNYQNLLKQELGHSDEIAAWWEVPQPLVEKAGLKWRGRFEWDWQPNIGFSPGYTPDERRMLVDVYMADFHAIFGFHPRTVGSWYIDEVTLDYMSTKYGMIAACNCRDQIGTDGYTLWGGYWNNAYYPSRNHAYMPAQHEAAQIEVPMFRMLGSDPIYQYEVNLGHSGLQHEVVTLEPVYPSSGGHLSWVQWFLGTLTRQPRLAFAFAQAGQENSFGWKAIEPGLTQQINCIAKEVETGSIEVRPLAEAGRWFRQRHKVTPPTVMIALDDWKGEGRRTVWYNSRYYRINFLWSDNCFFVRDIHLFDENVVSPCHDLPLTETALVCQTLPILDGHRWSSGSSPGDRAATRPVWLSEDGIASVMEITGAPLIDKPHETELEISQALKDGGTLVICCQEDQISFRIHGGAHSCKAWAFELSWSALRQTAISHVGADRISFRAEGVSYQLELKPHGASCVKIKDFVIRMLPAPSGELTFGFRNSGNKSSDSTPRLLRPQPVGVRSRGVDSARRFP